MSSVAMVTGSNQVIHLNWLAPAPSIPSINVCSFLGFFCKQHQDTVAT